jgi:uncharacterized membrane protein
VRRGGGRRLTARPAFGFPKVRLFGLTGAAVAAVLVMVAAPAWLRGTVRWVAAYDALAVVLLAFDWLFALRNDALHTEHRASQEDPGRNVVLVLLLLSVAAGLAAAIVILGKGAAVPQSDRPLALAFGVLAVVLGWFLIHSTFIFRYAHLYYYDSDKDGTAQGGLNFPGTTQPDDYDFAYYSFVIGMTCQVSDVAITDPGVRSLTLFHALLSFGYNTAILALGVNLASGLLGH